MLVSLAPLKLSWKTTAAMEHMDVLVEQADMNGALAVPNEAAHVEVSSYVEGLLSYLQSMRELSPAHPQCVSDSVCP